MSPPTKRPAAGEVAGGSSLGAASERMMLMRAFGQKLRQLRHAAGLTPDSLAHKSQVSPARISSAENGRKEPSLSLILKLCDGLEVTPNELIGDLPIAQERRRG